MISGQAVACGILALWEEIPVEDTNLAAINRASLVAQMVKNPPAMQETQVQSLGLEDPLEEEVATHSSILAWEIPWTESGGLQSMGLQKSQIRPSN